MKVILPLLTFLWVYTAGSKLADLAEFKRQLYNQVFSRGFANSLLWFIPGIEITAALLLTFTKTRLAGYILSTLLMLAFTGYILGVLLGFYDRVPCSCGGVLKSLGWQAHLWFNLFFTAVAATGIILTYKQRRAVTTMSHI